MEGTSTAGLWPDADASDDVWPGVASDVGFDVFSGADSGGVDSTDDDGAGGGSVEAVSANAGCAHTPNIAVTTPRSSSRWVVRFTGGPPG